MDLIGGLMPASDCELIKRIQQKDETAFDLLFSRYKNDLYRFIYYLTQNRSDADDLFQETWLRIVNHIPETAEIKNVRPWMCTIAVNLHRDELRKKRIRRLFFRKPSDSEFGETELKAVQDDYYGNSSPQIEISMSLSQAINNLPLKQRRVFVLQEIEGFKQREISDILNIPLGTVKSLLHRAVKRLQNELADDKI
jgi:RNA polymerase sigma-70 factor (ECF subfamily)